jgi:hypothetical protein
VPDFRPSVVSEAGETEQLDAPRRATPTPVPGNLLKVSEQLAAAPAGSELASLAPAAGVRALAAGAVFTSTYSDGTVARTQVIAVEPASIRFTLLDRTTLRAQVAVAVGSEIIGRYTVDSATGSVSVSALRSVGTLGGGQVAAARGANRFGVRMSSGSGAPLEYSVSVAGGVLTLALSGAAAQAVLGESRDEALLKLLVGQAILDATTRLKAGNITAVRLLGGS